MKHLRVTAWVAAAMLKELFQRNRRRICDECAEANGLMDLEADDCK